MNKQLSTQDLSSVLGELFAINAPLSPDTDLSEYIKDSIDLGELCAVIKERFDVEPEDMALFKKYTRFNDVLKIFNKETKN